MNDRSIIAAHEAGHAVVAAVLQQPIARVAIAADGETLGSRMLIGVEREVAGRVDRVPESGRVIDELLVVFAGPIAEYCARDGGRPPWELMGDLEPLYDTLWGADAALVAEVSDRFIATGTPSSEILKILHVFYEQSFDLVEKHMGAIRALTEALIEAGDVSGDEVYRIVEQDKDERRRRA